MEKQEYKALKEQLFSKRRNGFDRLDGAERAPMEAYCEDYKAFLDLGKTERICAAGRCAWRSRPVTGPTGGAPS